MASSVVRADYDALKGMSQAFGQGASEARQALQRLKSQVDVLEGGDWLGMGAQAFYQEMNGTVMPTMARLVKALEEAQRVTLQISQIMKAAEDEAAGYLNQQGGGAPAGQAPGDVNAGAGAGAGSGGAATGDAGSGGSDAGGTVGVVAGMVLGGILGGPLGALAGAVVGQAVGEIAGEVLGGSAAGGSPGGDAGTGNPLVVRDANSLFSDSALQGMVGSRPQGADTPALRSAMYELAQNPTGADLDRVLHSIADARGVPFEQIQAQHGRFLQVQQQAEAFRQANDGEAIPPVNRTLHEDFMGSTPQLRFGQMVGDAFGIDPVFGSMLSPTGGMVGPGNGAFTPSNDSAIGYHGVAHDAAGYLYNYHGIGPGYDYLNREGLDRGNPLTGQVTGTRYWVETIHPSTSRLFEIKDQAVDFTVSSFETVRGLAENVRIF